MCHNVYGICTHTFTWCVAYNTVHVITYIILLVVNCTRVLLLHVRKPFPKYLTNNQTSITIRARFNQCKRKPVM